mmetsp:Transcript_96929/g.278445  ORF Transcript_96929/g.278445 Transcript_96929/m.278445 type:complete len:532 (+) Transcript_96929:70-1665(+)
MSKVGREIMLLAIAVWTWACAGEGEPAPNITTNLTENISAAAAMQSQLGSSNVSNTLEASMASGQQQRTQAPRLRGSVARTAAPGADTEFPLRQLNGAGASAAMELRACADKEQCLLLVDNFLSSMPHQTVNQLVQTFGHVATGGGGPCGHFCELVPQCDGTTCRYDVYDNAVAAIYLTHRGKLQEARNILDTFSGMLYNGGQLNLLYAAYASSGTPIDWNIDTGNNAWVGMAYAHFAAASGEACYAAVGRSLLRRLATEAQCKDTLGGFMARLPRGKGKYRATEHNIDMYALARMLGDTDVQAQAGGFVRQMYGIDTQHPDSYATGTMGDSECDDRMNDLSPVAADTQFWNLLSDADPEPARKRASLASVLRPSSEGGLLEEDQDILGDGARLLGVRFTNMGSGAQWENTASATMGMGYYLSVFGDEDAKLNEDLKSMENSLLHLLQEYGSVLASVRGGNFDAWRNGNTDPNYPGGSDTGLGWTYLRYPHTAATAWTGLMILEGNPFAPPQKPVPAADAPLPSGCPAGNP